MPWHIEKRDDEWCVIKDADDEVEGCHDSREKAERQRRALYASEASALTSSVTSVPGEASVTITGVPGLELRTAESGTVLGFVPFETATQSSSSSTLSLMEAEAPVAAEAPLVPWRGLLTLERLATDDGRIFMEWDWRDLPLDLMAQFENEEGHGGSVLVGRIDAIWKEPMEDMPGVLGVYGEGVFNREPEGQKAVRLRRDKMLAGVSVDFSVEGAGLVDPETMEFVDEADIPMEEMLFGGNYLMGARKATIAMATMVGFPAFRDAHLTLLASGGHTMLSPGLEITEQPKALTASAAGAAPLAPPKEWFEQPEAREPTPLTVTSDGRVYGHLALWNQCHSDFATCETPPRSRSGYRFFHLGEIETAEGELVSVGRVTVGKGGAVKGGHASIVLGTKGAIEHYDQTGCTAAFVRATDGRHGIWLSGAVRSDVPAEKVRDLRAHPPSGDWRWEGGGLELVGVLSVVVPGFAIPRAEARVASAGADGEEQVLALIASGYVEEPVGPRAARRQMRVLRREVLGADDWR